MRTLGLNVSGYISSAALVEDGEILAGLCEERLSGLKRDRSFPARAIRSCMETALWRADELDAVAVAWNPARHMGRDLRMLHEANASRARYLTYVPNALQQVLPGEAGDRSVQEILGRRVVYVDHHLAHAASACLTSPWERCAFVTLDAFGEEDSLTIGRFAPGTFETLQRVRFPHSVGMFYSYVTEFLGFQKDADEYKVMALGAYATQPRADEIAARMAPLVSHGSEDRGGQPWYRFELDLRRFDFYLFDRPRDFGPLAEALGVPPRAPRESLTEEHFAVAWALGRHFEAIVEGLLRHARRVTGEENVALAGGCFMNSVANGKLVGPSSPFADVHIPPYPDDSGTAIGAALFVDHVDGHGAHRPCRHGFFGPSVSDDEAARALTYRKVAYERVEDLPRELAAEVAGGRVVGVARGRMEFGQRALGHRSILADPRNPDVRRLLNENVKNREWFRPYGVSVLAEEAAAVFDLPEGFRADFMERVRPVRPEWAARIGGVLHADGSVRLHIVDRDVDPEFHAIIRAFHEQTGVPLVVNTSFNVAGQPIVCTAEDALACFFSCGVDTLFVDHIRVRKGGAGLGHCFRPPERGTGTVSLPRQGRGMFGGVRNGRSPECRLSLPSRARNSTSDRGVLGDGARR